MNKKGESLSLGDAILISGRADTFADLEKEWNILAVHNLMCTSWKQTKEEREAMKQEKIKKAKERDERTRSSDNRLHRSSGGPADRNRSSSKGSKGRSKGHSRGLPRSKVSWKGMSKGKK